MIQFIFLIVLAYLMGSICSAIIVCKACSLPDPREAGSKNPGATNVLRLAGKQYAAIVMAVDLLKGTIPVIIAQALDAGPTTVAFTALAAVVGHMYPVFFDFKGGKGVATTIGALLAVNFIVGVLVIATWIAVAKVFRYSSLASLVSITLSPFYVLFMGGSINTFPPLLLIVILIIFKHKDNITRLMDGQEPKLKLKHTIIEEVMEPSHGMAMNEENFASETVSAEETIVADKPKAKKATKPKAKKSTEAEKPVKKKAPAKPKAKPKAVKKEEPKK